MLKYLICLVLLTSCSTLSLDDKASIDRWLVRMTTISSNLNQLAQSESTKVVAGKVKELLEDVREALSSGDGSVVKFVLKQLREHKPLLIEALQKDGVKQDVLMAVSLTIDMALDELELISK